MPGDDYFPGVRIRPHRAAGSQLAFFYVFPADTAHPAEAYGNGFVRLNVGVGAANMVLWLAYGEHGHNTLILVGNACNLLFTLTLAYFK